ncbi:MAG: cyclopropane-fatty-acyl-phospholipid synthase family protein [Pseudomonadota bacterium]|nr:cyclopropane-fatty-acyl-phospholipid synthase family protein [Pseudomonadota bacterium]
MAVIGERVLRRVDRGLVQGRIDATLPDGRAVVLGARAEGPAVIVMLHRWRALRRLASGGSAGWYEAWADGDWSSPDPVALFELFMLNRVALGGTARARGPSRWLRRVWHALRRNDRGGARRNIEAHYDLGNDFYAEWLDPSLTYSSALFDQPIAHEQPLEDAQRAKLRAILDRTGTTPGETVLEIGCGWGSFAEEAARAGRRVHAITLSTEQQGAVAARMARQGLGGVTVALTDYRDITGTYDAVASIEMVEAVGQAYWPAYLQAIAGALKSGGRAAIQLIAIDDAIFDAYADGVDFIQRHVFPGGMLLSERRFRALAEEAGLIWRDRHGFGLDYAETLKRWRERFETAVRESRLPHRFDRNFIDLWRYYLMYCEGGFRGGGIDVMQVTLVKA